MYIIGLPGLQTRHAWRRLLPIEPMLYPMHLRMVSLCKPITIRLTDQLRPILYSKSPCVYIAFPAVSATDNCGVDGSIHTSITLACAPEDVSTAVIQYQFHNGCATYLTQYSPFNATDAECPPISLAGSSFVIVIGSKGRYEPVMSAPANVISIDPAWKPANCAAADSQGNDPAYALTPAAALVISTTSASPRATTSAVPNQALPTFPA